MKNIAILGLLCVLSLASSVWAQNDQLMTLGAPDGERFTIEEKQWPETVGEADICLWKDDAHAAVAITIDDNTVPDHDWWVQTCETYGIKVTWFIITHQVTANPSFCGPWSQWQYIHTTGNDIQSHTVTHLNFDRGFDPNDPLHDIYVEYGKSITDIETNVPGTCVETLAYPGGANTSYNDDAVAAQYYIAARGTAGVINAVNKVNYIRTNSVGGGLIPVNPSAVWNQLLNLFDKSIRPRDYRGWYVCHWHGASESGRAQIITGLDYLVQKDAEVGVWIGTFREQAKYGQERDSAVFSVDSVSADQITMSLSDMMSDIHFNFPLTIKVRISNDWAACSAAQGGNAIESEIIEHEGNKYALVQAVPDQGQVVLAAANGSIPGDCDDNGYVDIFDFLILKSNFGTQSGATFQMGDFDGNGTVDIFDFLILKANFGSGV